MKTDDLLEDIETLGDLAEGDIGALAVEGRCLRTCHEEELGSGRIWSAGAGHHEVTLGVCIRATFVFDGVPDAVARAETATLDDVDGGVSTEDRGAVVVLVPRQRNEVVHGARHCLGVERNDNRAFRCVEGRGVGLRRINALLHRVAEFLDTLLGAIGFRAGSGAFNNGEGLAGHS